MAAAVRHKEFRFPVEIGWDGGRRTTARVAGKPPLPIATPPEFRGSDPDRWSPEDAFVAAVSLDVPVETRLEIRPRAGAA